MPVVRAGEKDLMDVLYLLRRCTGHMNRQGMFHWNSSYPSREIVLEDILRGELYLYQDSGICKGIMVLNENQSEEYKQIEWTAGGKKVLVVHRLAVNPVFQGKGIGRRLMEFALHFMKTEGYDSIRLDVIESNRGANRMYREMGFSETGSFYFPFQKSPFICYELQG